MNIPQETLDEWALALCRANRDMNSAGYALRHGEVPPAQSEMEAARRVVSRVWDGLVLHGAKDPITTARPEPHPLTPDLLASDANKRLAHFLREAAKAAADVERERNDEPDFSEQLSIYADMTEQEIFGPPAPMPGLE